MLMKNKIAMLTILAAMNFNFVQAATIDDELAVIAAEQDNSGNTKVSEVKPSEPEKKSKRELKAEAKAAEKKRKEELKAAEKEIREAQKKSRDEDAAKLKISQRDSDKKNFPKIDPVTPKTETVRLEKPVEQKKLPVEKPVEQKESPVETFTPSPTAQNTPNVSTTPAPVQTQTQTPTPTTPAVTQTPAQSVALPNPIVMFSNFEELAHAVRFTPLYIPRKSGFTINSMMAIDGHTAEIRYGRRWEPEVSLHIRTYKRMNGEELKDISGVYGVKWRVDMTSGTTVYIAKIEENKHVAAWAAGDYTFSAYAENLSFAAFHAIVADELVDLANHYYV